MPGQKETGAGLILMTNTHNREMDELVVGKDLSWMYSYHAVHEREEALQ